MFRRYFDQHIRFELKGDFDLVTEADRASEKLIVGRLGQLWPDHAIVAEEGSGHESASEYRWYVDPLDGTTNFAHGYPIFNVTMALEKAGEMIAGVVFDPLREELFTSEKGSGAFLNGRRIQVSRAAKLDDSLFSDGLPHPAPQPQREHSFLPSAGDGFARGKARRIGGDRSGLRGIGAARWVLGIWAHPWDMAAGKLLVA